MDRIYTIGCHGDIGYNGDPLAISQVVGKSLINGGFQNVWSELSIPQYGLNTKSE